MTFLAFILTVAGLGYLSARHEDAFLGAAAVMLVGIACDLVMG